MLILEKLKNFFVKVLHLKNSSLSIAASRKEGVALV